MTFLTVPRGGEYLRVADPAWEDPLDGSHAAERGGRWNPPRSFPVLHLNADEATARANVARRFAGLPYGPEDLDPAAGPTLVHVDVAPDRFVDVVTDDGCAAAGLPRTYPRARNGRTVPHRRCQPIGREAWERGHPGVACRSAAPGAGRGEELAWFPRGRERPALLGIRGFAAWFWAAPEA